MSFFGLIGVQLPGRSPAMHSIIYLLGGNGDVRFEPARHPLEADHDQACKADGSANRIGAGALCRLQRRVLCRIIVGGTVIRAVGLCSWYWPKGDRRGSRFSVARQTGSMMRAGFHKKRLSAELVKVEIGPALRHTVGRVAAHLRQTEPRGP